MQLASFMLMSGIIFFCLLILTLMAGCGGKEDALISAKSRDYFQVIYGQNTVKEIDLQSTPRSAASVALVTNEAWEQWKKKKESYTVEEVYGELAGINWLRQPSVAFCSGVLISEEKVLTAGHCFELGHSCENTVFVINFEKSKVKFAEVEGLSCKQISHQKIDKAAGLDYALVHLAKKTAAPQIRLRSSAVPRGSGIHAIGYPLGSFKKHSDGVVRSLKSSTGEMVTTLDVFEGNSGSPVFLNQTQELIGILSGGESDFKVTEDGESSLRHCSVYECMGETVTSIEKILADIAKQK